MAYETESRAPGRGTSRTRVAVGVGVFVALVGVGVAAWTEQTSFADRDRAVETALGGARSGATGEARGATAPFPSQPRAGAVAPASAPFDLAAIIHQVHFAYRPAKGEPGRYEGGHSTYSSAVDARGVTLVAFLAKRSTEAERDDDRDPMAELRSRMPRKAGEVVEGRPLRLELERMARGGVRGLARGGEPQVAKDGHLDVSRGEAMESYRNREEGVEQSWSFERAPRGEGDLVVRIRPSGLAYAGATEAGLHFADAQGLGFRYGHGTWVEANGRRTTVTARYVRGAIELVVPSDVLDESAYPAVLDPTISPEFGVDEVVSPAQGGPHEPSVASNGTDYLVAWADGRDGTTNIYGARVTSDGVVLDASGLLLSDAADSEREPSVASNGTDYFVAWEAENPELESVHIYGTRVTSAGVVLDAAGLLVSDAALTLFEPSVASNGTDYFVAWQDTRSGSVDIYGARVTSDGDVLDAAGLLVSDAVANASDPSVASNGTDYFVAWEDSRDGSSWNVYGARVTSDGLVLDTLGLLVAGGAGLQLSASVASNGTDYFVAWTDKADFSNMSTSDIYGARVTSEGVVSDAAGLLVSGAASDQSAPSVTSNGTDYFVAWNDYRNDRTGAIYGARVTSAGVVLDAAGLLVSDAVANTYNPSVASNGTDYFVAWPDTRSGGPGEGDIYGARVTSDGVVSDASGLLVSTVAKDQYAPSVASNGTDYFVAWEDYRSRSTRDIYGVRVTSAGVVLDASGLLISDAADHQLAPSVASNGTDYFVAWYDFRDGSTWDIYGARVTSDGVVLDASGLLVSNAARDQWAPSVTSNGTDYFVAWEDVRDGSSWNVYGARVTSDGVVLDASGLLVSGAAGSQYAPSVASNGTDYFVAWQDERSGSTYDIYGARVTSDGVVSDASGLLVSNAAREQNAPSVASNGTDYFVAWEDYRSGGTANIYGARVTSDGEVSDASGLLVSNAAGDQVAPSVTSNGTDYFVAWEDHRSGSSWDIYGTRVRSGAVESPLGIAFAADSSADEHKPALAEGPGGQLLLAYERFPEGTYYVNAARVRLIHYGADLGATCAADADCESGSCVDGVCCNEACGGGDTTDCLACSTTAGAAVDGTCGPVVDTSYICRASAGECDAAETCDGVTTACPADAAEDEGTACGGAPSGGCDAQDTCVGTVGATATCTANLVGSGVECAPASCTDGSATPASYCTGDSAACPSVTATACEAYACGATACFSECTLDSECASGAYCDENGSCAWELPDGAACSSDTACTSNHCVAGTCVAESTEDGGVDAGTGVDGGSGVGIGSGVDGGIDAPLSAGGGCSAPGGPGNASSGLLALLVFGALLGARRRGTSRSRRAGRSSSPGVSI